MTASARYPVVAATSRFEMRQQGSRFLAIIEPVRDEATTRERLEFYRREYDTASHVCWAWRIGSAPREGRSDAGEPPGTAGTPMLQVLRGSELSDVLAVVVRWFGGVKLGKGGLARAYARAVREALDSLVIHERRSTERLRVRLPFDRVGDLKRLIHPPVVELIAESYSDCASFTLEIESDHRQDFEEAVHRFATSVESAGN